MSNEKEEEEDVVGEEVRKSTRILGFEIATSTNVIFMPKFQQLLDRFEKNVKMKDAALRKEVQDVRDLRLKMDHASKEIRDIRQQKKDLTMQMRAVKSENSILKQNLERVEKEKRLVSEEKTSLLKSKSQQKKNIARLEHDRQMLEQQNHELKNQFAKSRNSVEETKRELKKAISQMNIMDEQLKSTTDDANRRIEKSEAKSSSNEKYLHQMFAQRDSPKALQLLQKRIGAPSGKMDADKSIFSLPIPCLEEIVQQTHHSVATMKISAAIFTKEEAPASSSQDACSFGEVDGRLCFAVADGVSTSSRQSEWAKALVIASIGSEELRESRFEKAKIQHQEDGERLTALVEPKLAWVWEEKLPLQSDATLLTGHISPDGSAELMRRGDTWAAMKKETQDDWQIIFTPSEVNGTLAVNSHSPLEFDETTSVSEISKLMVMTDGVASIDSKFLDDVWNKVTENDPAKLEEFINQGRQEKTFENDDITIVAIDVRGFRHN